LGTICRSYSGTLANSPQAMRSSSSQCISLVFSYFVVPVSSVNTWLDVIAKVLAPFQVAKMYIWYRDDAWDRLGDFWAVFWLSAVSTSILKSLVMTRVTCIGTIILELVALGYYINPNCRRGGFELALGFVLRSQECSASTYAVRNGVEGFWSGWARGHPQQVGQDLAKPYFLRIGLEWCRQTTPWKQTRWASLAFG
jgi:hypothetical protein